MRHNPFVEGTKGTTTLYASDRDVFLFLVDDANPIEAGRLPNGDPDLFFRGFYCWNSAVGSKTLGMATFYLRAVCMNRNIWGAESFEEISRSEEHTSELQSLMRISYDVFCLKKKQQHNYKQQTTHI